MVYECGKKTSLTSRMLQVVNTQMNNIMESIKSLTTEAESLQNVIKSLILMENSRDSLQVNASEPDIEKD